MDGNLRGEDAAMKRALKKSVEARRLLRLPRALDEAVKKDAAEQGISVAEWWRETGFRAILRAGFDVTFVVRPPRT